MIPSPDSRPARCNPLAKLAGLLALLLTFALHSAAANAPLRNGDTIQIRVGGVPAEDVGQISSAYTIDGEGMINLPHIGRLRAVGFTAGQLQTVIENAYKSARIYTNPTITISQQGGALTVNLGGEVKSPQRVAYTPDLTLLKAIIAAGDFSDYADQKRVRLLRGNEVMIIDVRKIRKDPSQDIRLLPGDDILIPQTWW